MLAVGSLGPQYSLLWGKMEIEIFVWPYYRPLTNCNRWHNNIIRTPFFYSCENIFCIKSLKWRYPKHKEENNEEQQLCHELYYEVYAHPEKMSLAQNYISNIISFLSMV